MPGLLETLQGIGKLSISRLTKDLKGLGKHSVSLPAKDCHETGKLSIFRIEKDITGHLKAFRVLVCQRLRGIRNVSVSLSATDDEVPQKAFNCALHENLPFVLTCQRDMRDQKVFCFLASQRPCDSKDTGMLFSHENLC